MAGYGVANERLRVLEELEREIGASLQSAGGRGLSGRGRGLSQGAGLKGAGFKARSPWRQRGRGL